jgi:hypothetical protein
MANYKVGMNKVNNNNNNNNNSVLKIFPLHFSDINEFEILDSQV